jgi:hypothetical protein
MVMLTANTTEKPSIKARLLLNHPPKLPMETFVMKNCETLDKMLRMAPDDRRKAGKVVARSFYKTLRRNGFSHGDIMYFAGYLLDGVIKEMKIKGEDQEGSADIREMTITGGSREVA